jgi:hypothetical protein
MRHLFLAAAMVATSMTVAILEDRAQSRATHANTVLSPPELADRWPSLRR